MREDKTQQPPWMASDLLHRPSVRSPYGYVEMARSVRCSFEALESAVRNDLDGKIQQIWTPLAPDQLMIVGEVPFLADAQLACIEARARRARFNGLLLTTALIMALPFVLSQTMLPLLFWMLFYTAEGIGMLGVGLTTLTQLKRRPTWEILREQAHASRFKIWMGRQRARLGWVLGGIIGAVGAAQILAFIQGDQRTSVAAAGIVKEAVWTGEIWRLVTGALLHANILHFALNIIALVLLARYVEVITHWTAVPLIFLVGALAGSFLSAVMDPRTSVGSSGGIMALLGAMIGFGLARKANIPWPNVRELTLATMSVFISGLMLWRMIDNWAHLGGLIAGLLLGWQIARSAGIAPIQAARGLQAAGMLALGATSAAGMATIWLLLR